MEAVKRGIESKVKYEGVIVGLNSDETPLKMQILGEEGMKRLPAEI